MYTDYVYPAFVTLLADIICLLFLESVIVFSLFSPSFSPCILSFLSLVYWPFHTRLLACLIREPFCISLVVCICLHPDALSSVVLISVLLYQSAAFVFLDGSRVSEGLVMVSLAFYLFVVGTAVFALCSSDCSRPLVCCRQ